MLINAARLFFLILLLAPAVGAKDYRLSVAQLPLYSESPDKGILIDILKVLDEFYTEGNFIIEVYPLQRSINNVINGRADLHFPTIGKHIWEQEDDSYEHALHEQGIRRSTGSLTKTHFALYSNRARPPIDASRIQDYRIETDLGHVVFFYAGIQGSTCLPCSVKKLAAGRIDGLIFAAREIDHIIADLGITNIRRQDYQTFGSKFILPNNLTGDEIDRLLQGLIIKMIRSGRLFEIADPYARYFLQQFGAPYLPTLDDISNTRARGAW